MNTKHFFQSHALAVVLSIIVVLVLVMGAFAVGERVGFHKASFDPNNGNHMMTDAHGSAGKVIAITLPTITIEDKDNTEKTVVVSDQTVIRKFRNTLTSQDIAVGDYIVAIGEPNTQSQIAATLIRILPPMPQ